MNVDELMAGQIPTLNTQRFMDDLMNKMDKYPKGSLSQRDVVESVNLGEMSYEEAMKIADKLNSEVTSTIQNFTAKITKSKTKSK